MKCQQVQDQLSAYLDGELTEELRQSVEVHLDSCHACRAELDLFARMESALDTLATATPPDLADRVVTRLRRPATPWWRSLSLVASLILGLAMGGALAGNFYSYQAAGNGNDVLALEEVFRDFPKGSWGSSVVSYQDEEEINA